MSWVKTKHKSAGTFFSVKYFNEFHHVEDMRVKVNYLKNKLTQTQQWTKKLRKFTVLELMMKFYSGELG